VVKIDLPPLRERKDDIPLLVDHFIRKFNLLKDRSIQGITPEVLSFLMRCPFPGNIRQLENIIEYAFISPGRETQSVWHICPGTCLNSMKIRDLSCRNRNTKRPRRYGPS
jgi:transcriptional regulator with PAS, ATPase and Fis domain